MNVGRTKVALHNCNICTQNIIYAETAFLRLIERRTITTNKRVYWAKNRNFFFLKCLKRKNAPHAKVQAFHCAHCGSFWMERDTFFFHCTWILGSNSLFCCSISIANSVCVLLFCWFVSIFFLGLCRIFSVFHFGISSAFRRGLVWPAWN